MKGLVNGCVGHINYQNSIEGGELNSQEEGPGGRQRTDASPLVDQDELWGWLPFPLPSYQNLQAIAAVVGASATASASSATWQQLLFWGLTCTQRQLGGQPASQPPQGREPANHLKMTIVIHPV